MSITHLLACLLVLLVGIYLVGLAVVSGFAPAQAKRFLGGFASSAAAHYSELSVRLFAGAAMLHYAPHLLFSAVFASVGWVLVVTTLGLFAVPWQWHQRFARWGVPQAVAHLRLFGVASFALGAFVIASVVLGSGARWLLATI